MKREHLVLYLVGIALSVAQFVMIRDFVNILYGEEVVIVLVTTSFFFGLSAGYLLALRLTTRAFRALFIGCAFVHLTFPFSYRYLAARLAQADGGGLAYLSLLVGYALIFNTVFATFLPRLVALPEQRSQSPDGRLRTCYALELAGFMSGFGLVAWSWNRPLGHLLIPYWIVLGSILHLTLGRRAWTLGYAAAAFLAVGLVGDLDPRSTVLLYRHKHSIGNPRVLYSVNSPYQKVEVIENAKGTRLLFLDGLLNLDSSDLEALNYYIAELPAALLRPRRTLLVGNGTLSSVPKVHPWSGEVVSVELDRGVLEAGRRFFTPPEVLQNLERWQLHVDDGKHFLRRSRDRYDLVVIDVPSPLTIQEAYLHTREFYELVRERLTEDGVIAVQLSGNLHRDNRTPARVAAALRTVFPEVMVLRSRKADRSFAYGARRLPFTRSEVEQQARSYEDRIEVIPPEQVSSLVADAVPLSVDRLDLVLRRGLERFANRYFLD